jgi:hypothetical protein
VELTVELSNPPCDEPLGWDDFVLAGNLHPTWRWSVVRASAGGRTGGAVVGVLRDAGRTVGLFHARLRGLGRVSPLLAAADVCNPSSNSLPGLVLSGGVPPTLQPSTPTDLGLLAAAVDAVESSLRNAFGRRIQAIAHRNVYADALGTLVQRSSIVGRGAPVALFRNRFTDYDSYLASLSKNRRKSQRRLVRQIDSDPDITTYFGPMPADADLASFNRLADETTRRNESRLWPPPAAAQFSHGQRVAMANVPGALAASYRTAEGRLVGFGLCFDHPRIVQTGPWGAVDPKLGGPRELWFHVNARMLRWTIEAGREGLIGGKGRIELKQELGFEAVPQWVVLRRMPKAGR